MIRPEKSMFFSPGIYEHAAALIDESPYAVSRDASLLFRAQKAARDLYHHPLLVAGIDVYNVEPEALGATLDVPAGHGVPSVISHPVPLVEGLLDVESPNPRSYADGVGTRPEARGRVFRSNSFCSGLRPSGLGEWIGWNG